MNAPPTMAWPPNCGGIGGPPPNGLSRNSTVTNLGRIDNQDLESFIYSDNIANSPKRSTNYQTYGASSPVFGQGDVMSCEENMCPELDPHVWADANNHLPFGNISDASSSADGHLDIRQKFATSICAFPSDTSTKLGDLFMAMATDGVDLTTPYELKGPRNSTHFKPRAAGNRMMSKNGNHHARSSPIHKHAEAKKVKKKAGPKKRSLLNALNLIGRLKDEVGGNSRLVMSISQLEESVGAELARETEATRPSTAENNNWDVDSSYQSVLGPNASGDTDSISAGSETPLPNQTGSLISVISNEQINGEDHFEMTMDTETPRAYQTMVPIYHCTFSWYGKHCIHSTRSRCDWIRHEESEKHWPQKRYMCLLCIETISDENDHPLCAFCLARLATPINNKAHYLQCEKAREKGRHILAAARDEHFRRHLQKYHAMPMSAEAATWTFPVRSAWPRGCGFCPDQFTTWEERTSHVALHFEQGADISSWKIPSPRSKGDQRPGFGFYRRDDDDDDNDDDDGQHYPRHGKGHSQVTFMGFDASASAPSSASPAQNTWVDWGDWISSGSCESHHNEDSSRAKVERYLQDQMYVHGNAAEYMSQCPFNEGKLTQALLPQNPPLQHTEAAGIVANMAEGVRTFVSGESERAYADTVIFSADKRLQTCIREASGETRKTLLTEEHAYNHQYLYDCVSSVNAEKAYSDDCSADTAQSEDLMRFTPSQISAKWRTEQNSVELTSRDSGLLSFNINSSVRNPYLQGNMWAPEDSMGKDSIEISRDVSQIQRSENQRMKSEAFSNHLKRERELEHIVCQGELKTSNDSMDRSSSWRKVGLQNRNLRPEAFEKALRMRIIQAGCRCCIQKTACFKEKACNRCRQQFSPSPLADQLSCRSGFSDFVPIFFPAYLHSHFEFGEVKNFINELSSGFSDTTLEIQIATGGSFQPMILDANLFRPKTWITTIDWQKSPPTQQYCAPIGLSGTAASQLGIICRKHIEAMVENPAYAAQVTAGDSTQIPREILCVAQRYSTAKDSPLIRDVLMLHAIHYFMGRLITFSESSVVKVQQQVQRIGGPQGRYITSRLLNRQIKFIMYKLQRDLTRKVLNGIENAMKSRRQDLWGPSFCATMVLCLCIEKLQTAADAFVVCDMYLKNNEPEYSRSQSAKACLALDEYPFQACTELFHFAYRSNSGASGCRGEQGFNPLRFLAGSSAGTGLDAPTEAMVRSIKNMFSTCSGEILKISENPLIAGLCDKPEPKHKHINANSTGRLISKFLYSFFETSA